MKYKTDHMKWILTILFFSVSVTSSFASSPQIPDYIIYKNDTIPTYNLLVEQYLQKVEEDEGRLFGLSFRSLIGDKSGSSLSCWRGYQAVYKIENDSLFVSKIVDCYSLKREKRNQKNYLKEVFGDKVKNDKVFVDWYSGKISFSSKRADNIMLRWDGIFEKIFMHELVINIQAGQILEISEQQNYSDLKNGIERLKKDSLGSILFKKIKNYKWTKLDKFDCSDRYVVIIGKKGKIADVVMLRDQTEESIEESSDIKAYIHCAKTLKKALSNLRFDILKRKGEPIEEEVIIDIWFEEDGTIKRMDW